MQVRFLAASVFVTALTLAGTASATPTLAEMLAQGACPELPICGNCKADIAHAQPESGAGANSAPGAQGVTAGGRSSALILPAVQPSVAPPSGQAPLITSTQGPYQLAPRASGGETSGVHLATGDVDGDGRSDTARRR